MRQSKIFWFLIFTLGANLLIRVYSYRTEYLTKYDPVYWESRYLNSQWVVPDSTQPIGDDGLYAYAGWEYIHGRDPTTLNAEMPPLGKYFVGLSILVFGNQNIFALACGLLVLFGLYKLNKLIFKNQNWALLPVVLFSFEPLFWQQLRAPFLDLLYLLFLLFTFYFLLKEKILLSVFFLGLMMATKASVATFILMVIAILGYLIISRQPKVIKRWLTALPIFFVVFSLVYIRYFWLGHGLISFLGVQKWILNFYSVGAKAIPQSVWQMLLTGRWFTWWNGIANIPEWWIGWAIMLVGAIVYWSVVIIRRKVDKSLLIAVWLLVYLIFLTFVPAWPRYLLVVIPFMYNLSVWLLPWSKNTRAR